MYIVWVLIVFEVPSSCWILSWLLNQMLSLTCWDHFCLWGEPFYCCKFIMSIYIQCKKVHSSDVVWLARIYNWWKCLSFAVSLLRVSTFSVNRFVVLHAVEIMFDNLVMKIIKPTLIIKLWLQVCISLY